MRKSFAVALLLMVPWAACTETQAPTEVKQPIAFAANPSSNGSLIVRSDAAFQFAVFDAEKQLLAFHNFRNAFPACGTPVTQISLFDLQEVWHEGAEELIQQLATSDHTYIWVWHSTTGNVGAARCTTPIATGVGSIVNTDSDLFSFLFDRVNANAFGFAAHATLTGSDGTTYQYSAVSRVKWQPNSPTGDERFQEIYNINLVPVGN